MLEYKDDKWKALIALAPTLLLMLVFTFYPIFNTVLNAFMEGYANGIWFDNGNAFGWLSHFGETVVSGTYNEFGELTGFVKYYVGIGLGNFTTIFKDPTFLQALKNTLIMVFISVDELLPASREYGEHHLSIYGLIAGMMVMAVSLLLFM